MVKRKKHLCRYKVWKLIVQRLSRTQLFLLCMLALVVLAVIGVYAPAALVGLF